MIKTLGDVVIRSVYFPCGKDMNLGEPENRLLWVSLCSPKDVEVLSLSACEYDLIWKWGLQIKLR